MHQRLGRHRRDCRRHRDPGREPGVRPSSRSSGSPPSTPARPRRRWRPTATATGGSRPRRRKEYGMIDPVVERWTTSARPWSRRRMRGCSHGPVHDPDRRRAHPAAASGRTTSTSGCCPSGSSSSAPRSTTAWRTSSSRSCSTSSAANPDLRDRDLYQLPRRFVHRAHGDLRHDEFVGAPIATYCVGQAASTAAVLLAAGGPGRRAVLEHARVLLGQPSSRPRAPCRTWPSRPRNWSRVRAEVDEILAQHTGHAIEKIRADMDRNKMFTARRRWITGWPTRSSRAGRRPSRPGGPR